MGRPFAMFDAVAQTRRLKMPKNTGKMFIHNMVIPKSKPKHN
jgi:hypothetical protein